MVAFHSLRLPISLCTLLRIGAAYGSLQSVGIEALGLHIRAAESGALPNVPALSARAEPTATGAAPPEGALCET